MMTKMRDGEERFDGLTNLSRVETMQGRLLETARACVAGWALQADELKAHIEAKREAGRSMVGY